MRKLALLNLLVWLLPGAATGQSSPDLCHVYLVDTRQAEKARETRREEDKAKAVTLLGEFSPEISEDDVTTKYYLFPGSGLVITASVVFTDELMGSKNTQDSMVLSISVSGRRERNSLRVTNNAVAEVTYDEHTDKVRVRKFLKMRGRTYVVGLECEFNRPAPSP